MLSRCLAEASQQPHRCSASQGRTDGEKSQRWTGDRRRDERGLTAEQGGEAELQLAASHSSAGDQRRETAGDRDRALGILEAEEELEETITTATGEKKDCLFASVLSKQLNVHKEDTSKELLEWGSRSSFANRSRLHGGVLWSPFLVELKEREGDRAKILHLDNLSASARFWRGADVMVFNTGHWWTHHGKMRAWDYFQLREELTEEMEPAEAFNKALRTWGEFTMVLQPNSTLLRQWISAAVSQVDGEAGREDPPEDEDASALSQRDEAVRVQAGHPHGRVH
ncbi:hypothetical protein ZIOFF_033910 [Zingiber officinale]|uniref:Trichome birefringence-like C-terminal domain-containing protein n=1 Tax=Zingiber officinale TaxID=94328 RepID=A0A8J5LCI7_ZINOF|nr:hypothetical protein ZIOFF_033910 [Zingiber officinale]